MTIVRQILKSKGYQIYSVPPGASVLEALQLMADRGIGAILVMDEGRVLGIFSERDYARRGVLQGISTDVPIRDLMTDKVYFVRPEDTTEQCMVLMTDKHIRHLPVLEGENVVGVISIGDVVKTIIEDQQYKIQGLENYILGREYHF